MSEFVAETKEFMIMRFKLRISGGKKIDFFMNYENLIQNSEGKSQDYNI